MRGSRAKHLRRWAEQLTVGDPPEATRSLYRGLKRVWKDGWTGAAVSVPNGPRVHTGAPGFDTRILIRNARHSGRIAQTRMQTYRENARQSKLARWLRDED